MTITDFSKKQGEILKFAYSEEETLICDGAVRSGKTIVMSLAFVLWAMSNFDKTNFAICGKTVSNAERNILKPFQQIEGVPFESTYKISIRMLTVKCGKKENYFYLFGGKDESSYALIQGLTLAGVLFDEVALMPKSFVDQAIARTLSFKNAKIWFNCNPESPNHWFYKEWISNKKKEYKHLHFLMKDNPILGEEEIERAEKLFSGVFFDRYILGKWVRAEGIVFSNFANNPKKWIVNKEELPERFIDCNVGFDIGGNGSAYAMTCTALDNKGNYYVLKSTKKQASELPMEEVERFAFEFIDDIKSKYNIGVEWVNTDHVDVIINTLNEKRYLFKKTYKPPLEDRPFAMSMLLAQNRVKFVEGECNDLVDELQNLVYDEKSEKAIVKDNGEMQIDTWDSFIYSLVENWKYLLEDIK